MGEGVFSCGREWVIHAVGEGGPSMVLEIRAVGGR